MVTSDLAHLDGMLQRPAAGKHPALGLDLVIIHHGAGGNFYMPSLYDDFAESLLDAGCAVLRVNNRGHDPMNRVRVGDVYVPMGAAYERLDECRLDWRAWLDCGEALGFRDIALWGHSLGAMKSIYYVATEADPRVRCVVAASPPRFCYSDYVASPEGEAFGAIAAEAQRQVAAGRPDALIETPYPVPIVVSAEVFLQKYGPDERFDVLRCLPQVTVPFLIMIGEREPDMLMAFRGLPEKVAALSGQLPNLRFASIPDTDHVYSGKVDYVWNLVSRWFKDVLTPAA